MEPVMEREIAHAQSDAFILFLKTEKHVADNTCRSYASDLRSFINFWGNYELQKSKIFSFKEITRHFRAFLLSKKQTASTAARKISCLNSFNRFLVKKGVMPEHSIQRPAVNLKNPSFISPQEISFLLDEVQNETLPTATPFRDKSILELLYATGMRCSELSTLQIADISFETHSITLRGKRRKPRTVFFGEKAAEQIKTYCTKERPIVENNLEILFLNHRGQPLTTRSIQRVCTMFSRFLQNKKPLTPQILRHSFAIHLLEQGTSIETVQELLGHITRISTERYIK